MPLTDSELTFVKFAGYLLILLWIMYLTRENFFPHKPDPRLEALIKDMQTMTATVSAVATRMESLDKAQAELVRQQRDDVRLIFAEIKGYNESVQKILREHEHDIAEAANRKPR